ncbi:MAG TPA: hypothetical protein VIH38_04100 [Steroidobacteraceae bacterium]
MSALFVGDAASAAVLSLSPWIIPVIAVAVKLTYDQTRGTLRSKFIRNRPSAGQHAAGEDRSRAQEALHDCIKAKTGQHSA